MINTPNYFIFDGILCSEYIDVFKQMNLEPISLFKGLKYEAITEYGPYILKLDENNKFWEWYQVELKFKNLGIFIYSDCAFEKLFEHLQKQLMINLQDNNDTFFFRYFDPRVAELVLPCLNNKQILEFFENIDYLIIDNHNFENFKLLTNNNGNLLIKDLPSK